MCSAVRRRMLVKGMISSVPAVGCADDRGRGRRRGRLPLGGARCAGAAGAGRCRRRCCGGRRDRRGRRAAGAAASSMKSSTSERVIRPPRPVPGDLGRVDAVVVEQPPHHGRQDPVAPLPVGRRSSGGRRCRRPGSGSQPEAEASAARRRPVPRARSRSGCRSEGSGGAGAMGGAGAGGAAGAGGRRGWGCRWSWGRVPRSGGGGGTVAHDGQHGADVDGVALLHADLGQGAPARATGPRSRPCRSRPRRAARRGPRSRRRP